MNEKSIPRSVDVQPARSVAHEKAPAMLKEKAFVHAAYPLLNAISAVQDASEIQDIMFLHAALIRAIICFEQTLIAQHESRPLLMIARYCLCAAIDEAILAKPEPYRQCWSQRCLLSHFHHDAEGGTRFFAVLEEACERLPMTQALTELLAIILALGFEGKFYLDADRPQLAAIQQRLYEKRCAYADCSPVTAAIDDTQGVVAHQARPIRVLFVRCVLVLLCYLFIFSGLGHLGIYYHMRPIVQQQRALQADIASYYASFRSLHNHQSSS